MDMFLSKCLRVPTCAVPATAEVAVGAQVAEEGPGPGGGCCIAVYSALDFHQNCHYGKICSKFYRFALRESVCGLLNFSFFSFSMCVSRIRLAEGQTADGLP